MGEEELRAAAGACAGGGRSRGLARAAGARAGAGAGGGGVGGGVDKVRWAVFNGGQGGLGRFYGPFFSFLPVP